MDAARVPPHSLEAEQAVLGALLLDNALLAQVSAILAPSDFYRSGHRLVYEAALELHGRGDPADSITVAEALRAKGLIEKAGGAAHVSALTDRVASTDHAEHYAGTVRDLAARRSVITAARRAEAAAFDGEDLDALRDRLHAAANALTPRAARLSDARTIARGLLDTWERLAEATEAPGLSTGLPDLDRVTRLHPGDLVIVAGRPGMGKTSFALGVTDANLRAGRRVLWLSLEMTAEALLARLAAARSGIAVEALRAGRLSDRDWPKASHALGTLGQAGLHVDDSSGIGSAHVRAVAQRVQAAHGLDLVVVDYLGLMEEPGRWEAKRLEVGKISRSLVRLAKDLRIPVVALSQLNREVENRKPPEPHLSDLRESGDLEQDADVVLLLNRPEVYLGKNTPEEEKHLAHVIVAKNRHGQTGRVKCLWDGPTTTFRTLERMR